MYKYLKTLPESAYRFLDEYQKKTEDGYEYSDIDGKFIHMLNGSNWRGDEGHEKRVNAILAEIGKNAA